MDERTISPSARPAMTNDSVTEFVPVARQNSDLLLNHDDEPIVQSGLSPCTTSRMLCLVKLLPVLVVIFFRSRRDLLLENLALRQQLSVLKRRPSRPRLAVPDRLFWVILRRFWSRWRETLILVQPETGVRWHRAGFKLYWTWFSRHRTRVGRKCVSVELHELIFRMVADNPTWGSPWIHGELKMLGFDISERTVLRWIRKRHGIPIRRSDGRPF